MKYAVPDPQFIRDLLDSATLSLADIARMCGCSREYVRQVYARDYSLAGRERLLRIREYRLKADRADLRPALQHLWSLAEDRGCFVSRLVERDGGLLRKSAGCLLINGRVCAASLCQTARRNGYGARYTQHTWSAQHDFVIAMQRVPRFPSRAFVIPICDLECCRSKSIFIPVNPRQHVYRNRRPAIDWTQYLDAWHLIA